jgi:hypothetical protein
MNMRTNTNTLKIYRWRKAKLNEGWKFLNYLLPQDIAEKVNDYKRTLMAVHKQKML